MADSFFVCLTIVVSLRFFRPLLAFIRRWCGFALQVYWRLFSIVASNKCITNFILGWWFSILSSTANIKNCSLSSPAAIYAVWWWASEKAEAEVRKLCMFQSCCRIREKSYQLFYLGVFHRDLWLAHWFSRHLYFTYWLESASEHDLA